MERFDETLEPLLAEAGHAGEPLVVAVSGGVDSMVLLTLTAAFARRRGIRCVAAHVDHGLRPASADDAAFVRDAAAKLQVGFLVRRIIPGSLPFANQSRGIEADARQLRHELLVEMAQAVQSRFILFAHHADDQLETLLLRLIRGTSPAGLAGIRALKKLNGFVYLRPLLTVTKRDLIAFAASHQIEYTADESNVSDLYLRNRIRHHVLPALYELAPALAIRTQALTQLLQDESDYLDEQATELLHTCCLEMDGVQAQLDAGLMASRSASFTTPGNSHTIVLFSLC